MAVSLRGEGYSCRRNRRLHSGKSRSRLIQALLRCSPDMARELAGERELSSPPPDENLADRVGVLLGQTSRIEPVPTNLYMPRSFKPLVPHGMGQMFWDYLADERGYDDEQIARLSVGYDLRYCVTGPFAYRLIFPVYSERRRLMTWTGRTIVADRDPRYKTLKTKRYDDEPDQSIALAPPGNLLLGLPMLWAVTNPKLLVVTEGPLDGTRITALGADLGAYGTSLFGLNASEQQAELLYHLASRFSKMVLLLDPDAALMVLQILNRFAQIPIEPARLPAGVEDPGALPVRLGRQFLQGLISK